MRHIQATTRRLVRTAFGGLVPWASFHVVFLYHVRTDLQYYRRYDVDQTDMLELFQINHKLDKSDVYFAAEPNDIPASDDIMQITGLTACKKGAEV